MKVKKPKPRKPKGSADVYNDCLEFLVSVDSLDSTLVKMPMAAWSMIGSQTLPANLPAIRFTAQFLLGREYWALVRTSDEDCYLVQFDSEASSVDYVEQETTDCIIIALLQSPADILTTYVERLRERTTDAKFLDSPDRQLLVAERHLDVEIKNGRRTDNELRVKYKSNEFRGVIDITKEPRIVTPTIRPVDTPFLEMCIEQGRLTVGVTHRLTEVFTISLPDEEGSCE